MSASKMNIYEPFSKIKILSHLSLLIWIHCVNGKLQTFTSPLKHAPPKNEGQLLKHSQYKFTIWFFLSILYLYLFSHNKNWFLIALMFYPAVCVQ